jgi:AraC-like DNA-binding protein
MGFKIDRLRIVNITFNQREGFWHHPVRSFPHHTLLWVVQGRLGITINNRENSVSSNELFLIIGGTPFRLAALPPDRITETYSLRFYYPCRGFSLKEGHYDLSGMPQLRLRFQQILLEQRNKEVYYIEKKKAALAELLIELRRIKDRKKEGVKGISLPVSRIINHIHSHLPERLKVSDLLANEQYSPVHFYRLFKTETGLSPKQYILQMRVRKARELLLESPMNMSQIADRCGYADVFDFSRRFKKATGYAPNVFRKALKT